jgi:hypothetical protein
MKKPLKKYAPFQINQNLRTPVKKVILFTNARDEENIKEWIIHHLSIGFNLIYIFDHKSVKPLKEELKSFGKRVIVERCEINFSPKIHLMNKAAKIASLLNVDWFIYLDADEFLILNYFKGVKEMLNRYFFADSLAINWLMFGTNYHKKKPNGLILEKYTKSDLKLNHHVKTFVRPFAVINATNPHYYNMVNPYRMFALNGKLMRGNLAFNIIDIHFNKSSAFIAHYYAQSEETYIQRKIKRPTDSDGIFRSFERDLHTKHNETDNFIPKNKYSERVKKILELYTFNLSKTPDCL